MRSLIRLVGAFVVLGLCFNGSLLMAQAPVNDIKVKVIVFRVGCGSPEAVIQLQNKSTTWEYKLEVSGTGRTASPGPAECGGICVSGTNPGDGCWGAADCTGAGGTCSDFDGTDCTVEMDEEDVVLTVRDTDDDCDHLELSPFPTGCNYAVSNCDNTYPCTSPFDPEEGEWCSTFLPVKVEVTAYREPDEDWQYKSTVVCEKPTVPLGAPECSIFSFCDEDDTTDLCSLAE